MNERGIEGRRAEEEGGMEGCEEGKRLCGRVREWRGRETEREAGTEAGRVRRERRRGLGGREGERQGERSGRERGGGGFSPFSSSSASLTPFLSLSLGTFLPPDSPRASLDHLSCLHFLPASRLSASASFLPHTPANLRASKGEETAASSSSSFSSRRRRSAHPKTPK